MAKQLTVRGLDPALDRRLREEAARRSQSVNHTTLDLLRYAVGLAGVTPRPKTDTQFCQIPQILTEYVDTSGG